MEQVREDMQAGTEGLSEGSSASTTAEGETRADEVWKPRDVEQDVQVAEAGMVKNVEMVKEEEKKQEVQVEGEECDDEEEEDEEEEDEEEEDGKGDGEKVTEGDSLENLQGQDCSEKHKICKDLSEDEDDEDTDAKAEEKDKEEDVNLNICVRCPLFKISPTMCLWFGALGNLETHVRDSHDDILTKGPNFVCKSLKNNVLLVLFNAEIFLYYKCFKENGMCYAAVQQVGTTNKKYNYTIKLLSVENTIGRIVIRFLMSNISAKLKRIFDAGRCMAIEHTVLKPFIKDDKINMIVTIDEVHP